MATLYYRPYTTELQNDEESNSSVSNRNGVLPEFQYIFDPDKEPVDNEPKTQEEGENENFERYKLAMRRMSTEILFLRDQMKNLIFQNSQLLCNNCGHRKDADVLINEVIDINSISKEELLHKYVELNAKYEETSLHLRTYQEKVHKLQIDLIKKNDREAEFLKINKAHSSQNILLQNMQKRVQKIKLLEETIKDQEVIISKMEKQIEKNVRIKKGNLSPIIEVPTVRERDFNFALQEENSRLRNEIEDVRRNQPKLKLSNSMSDSERLELYQLLDKAEQRIMAFEKQISENRRELQREKKKNAEADNFGLAKIKF